MEFYPDQLHRLGLLGEAMAMCENVPKEAKRRSEFEKRAPATRPASLKGVRSRQSVTLVRRRGDDQGGTVETGHTKVLRFAYGS